MSSHLSAAYGDIYPAKGETGRIRERQPSLRTIYMMSKKSDNIWIPIVKVTSMGFQTGCLKDGAVCLTSSSRLADGHVASQEVESACLRGAS